MRKWLMEKLSDPEGNAIQIILIIAAMLLAGCGDTFN